ncbi:MAG: hypothetical protein CM1200mP9_03340 [Gammaproteobacteria bacterium]|nr:MAG: hypothetical protein CM1200mP9_03340 [Gammaproteobacteria bacterium]
MITTVTPALAEALDLDVENGALINQVVEDSAAQAAGLLAGDVVVAVDGTPIDTAGDLRNRIGMKRVDDDVNLKIIREGEQQSINAKVGEPGATMLAGGTKIEKLKGAEFTNIPPDHPQHGQVVGVLVTTVESGSPAARSGLRQNDIVQAVNNRDVRSVNELSNVTGKRECDRRPKKFSAVQVLSSSRSNREGSTAGSDWEPTQGHVLKIVTLMDNAPSEGNNNNGTPKPLNRVELKDAVNSTVDIVGALDFDERESGIAPRRLPAWTRSQVPDGMDAMLRMPSGRAASFQHQCEKCRTSLFSFQHCPYARRTPQHQSKSRMPGCALVGKLACW